MLRFFKKLWTRINAPDIPALNMQQMLNRAGIEKRRNLRVYYPPQGPRGDLPSCLHEGEPAHIFNLSLTGIALANEDHFGPGLVGSKVNLTLNWGEQKAELSAELVGLSHQSRHFRFTEFPDWAKMRLKRILQPAAAGQALKQLKLAQDNLVVRIAARELWKGLSGEALAFHGDTHGVAELSYGTRHFIFKHQQAPGLMDQGKFRAATPLESFEALICLCNVKNPSPAVLTLMKALDSYLTPATLKRTGTS